MTSIKMRPGCKLEAYRFSVPVNQVTVCGKVCRTAEAVIETLANDPDCVEIGVQAEDRSILVLRLVIDHGDENQKVVPEGKRLPQDVSSF